MPLEVLPPNTYYLDPFSEIVGINFGGYTLTIEGGTDVNVFFAALAAGLPVLDGFTPKKIKLTVRVTADVLHLIWGTFWHPDSTLKLVNLATITGRGGNGGAGGDGPGIAHDGANGASGQHAIDLDGQSISVDNEAGYIFGGGGGGGGGGAISAEESVEEIQAVVGGGGGGGGRGGAPSGGAAGETQQEVPDFFPQTEATAGGGGGASAGAGGAGGTVTNGSSGIVSGGAGGSGGDYGEPGAGGSLGTAGLDWTLVDFGQAAAGTGGAAGKAINLSGGAVNWLSGNSPDRVKGAVT